MFKFIKEHGHQILTNTDDINYQTITNFLNEEVITEKTFDQLHSLSENCLVSVIHAYHVWLANNWLEDN